MKLTIKILIIISSIVIVTALGGGIIYLINTGSGTTSGKKSDWHVYKNDKYRFQLNFGPEWEGYSVTEETDFGKSYPVARYNFFVPKKNGGSQWVFRLEIYKNSVWDTLEEEQRTLNLVFIKKSASYSFTYAKALKWPDSWGPIPDVPKVTNTLSFY